MFSETLEGKLQPHPHRPAEGFGLSGIQECRRLAGGRDRTTVDRSRRDEVAEVHGIKRIGHLNAVFQVGALGELELLGNRQIQVIQPRGEKGIAAHGPGIGSAAALNPMHGARINAGSPVQIGIQKARGAGRAEDCARVQRGRRIADVRPVRSALTIAIAIGSVNHGKGEAGLPVGNTRYRPAT